MLAADSLNQAGELSHKSGLPVLLEAVHFWVAGHVVTLDGLQLENQLGKLGLGNLDFHLVFFFLHFVACQDVVSVTLRDLLQEGLKALALKSDPLGASLTGLNSELNSEGFDAAHVNTYVGLRVRLNP